MKKATQKATQKTTPAMTAFELLRASVKTSPLYKKSPEEIKQLIQEARSRHADKN